MRRKSERNKAKASPEKKVEKPTRKSTRRRAKKSPSTSPERENSNDAGELQTTEKETIYKIQTRLHSKETDNAIDEPETKVSSTETITEQQDVEDSGSVWKAARADASPGEIPKLKLCRQRNLSETSDVSLSRKRTSKWQESGSEGGVAEEADSADERPALSLMVIAGNEPADNPSSTIPGRDSGEEVSDSKEFPSENATADLSDDKPNIDRHDDTNETTNCTATTNVDSEQPAVSDTIDEMNVKATDIDANGEQPLNKETIAQDQKEKTEVEVAPEQKETLNQEPAPQLQSETEAETEVKSQSKLATVVNEETKETIRKDATSSDDDNDDDDDDNNDKERKKPMVERLAFSDNSNDEESSENVKRTISAPTRGSRRKHRDKYRDSSNSESGDSDDEPIRIEKIVMEPEEVHNEPLIEDTNEVSKKSTEADYSTSSLPNETSVTELPDDNMENEKSKDNIMTEKTDHIVASSAEPTPISKPIKVNLKRTFALRISSNLDAKKDNADTNDTIQDKKNHVSGDQVEPDIIPKKRRWGTGVSTDVTPTFSISTDFLKTLVPGAKPLSISEVRLSKDDDEERSRRRDREKRYNVIDGPVEKSKEDIDSANNETVKNDNHIAARRKISIVKDTTHAKSPSPPPSQPTNILLIKNLVRPFTLNQIKELLSRTGTIVENGFWMDRIKSKCFVEYSNEDQAFETRQALHGISWPPSNPKKLCVEYASKEDMEQTRESSKDQTPLRKAELTEPSDIWQQEWGRGEKSNATTKVTVVREWDLGKEDGQHLVKDKDREKKDIDKKRRPRSRSPGLDSHLPAPARKFKKKEDEPPPAKLLDDLFRKTKATPCIYWLPLTNEQIVVKEEMRRQHMAEHARRLEEMRRAERNRDGRRRRSPRK